MAQPVDAVPSSRLFAEDGGSAPFDIYWRGAAAASHGPDIETSVQCMMFSPARDHPVLRRPRSAHRRAVEDACAARVR